jgi:hypothetical protein
MNKLSLPRADAKGLGIGPRDVPEEADPGIRTSFLDQSGKERKVIILDQDDGFIDALELC